MILEGLKLAKRKTGSVAQVVECRLSKGEALSSNLNTPKGKKKKVRKEERRNPRETRYEYPGGIS
jgi:hypothetical protein